MMTSRNSGTTKIFLANLKQVLEGNISRIVEKITHSSSMIAYVLSEKAATQV